MGAQLHHWLWGAFRDLKSWLKTPAGIRVQQGLGLLVSVVIVIILARAVGKIGWQRLVEVVPADPLFWILYSTNYMTQPVVDWLIYRPWWRLGWRDFGVFLKKQVLNEGFFAYAGDAWLMGWATRRLALALDPAHPLPLLGRGAGTGLDPARAPFAAIKDMALTSGLAGNLFTFLMLLLAILMGAASALTTALDPGILRKGAAGFAGLLAFNLLILINRDSFFSLEVRYNIRGFALHFARVAGAHILLLASWMVALPMVGLGAWLALGALRLVISRMPVPNKQLLFAAVAATVAGDAAPMVAALMAAQGVLTLAGHVLTWFMGQAMMRKD